MTDESLQSLLPQKKSPGKLISTSDTISIHTQQALLMFYGREATSEKSAIIGVTQFASMIKHIYPCSPEDPWADWWLLKIERALDQAKDELHAIHVDLAKKLEAIPNVHIAISKTDKPVYVPINFTNPLSYRAAFLVTDFDLFCRLVLTTRHCGIIGRDYAEELLVKGGKPLRRAYHSVVGYKFSGATRKDVIEQNQIAKKAEELMGTLPDEIIKENKQSDYARKSIYHTSIYHSIKNRTREDILLKQKNEQKDHENPSPEK